MTDEKWVTERWQNFATEYRVRTVLHEEKTEFQHMQLVDTYLYGRMLLLDGIVQTTEKDEFHYHEMMVHVPMISHPDPKRVLIIGGGDGGILREVLRHPGVERAVMVEIDDMVVDFSIKHLPTLSAGAFDDPRAEVVIADGATFVKETTEKFDVVIVDSPDPVGPAKVLFAQEFYAAINGCMSEQGIVVRQSGSTIHQPDEQREAYERLNAVFAHTAFYTYCVPTYVGGLFSSAFASQGIDPCAITLEHIKQRVQAISLETLYYTPGLHVGAFDLPAYMRRNLGI